MSSNVEQIREKCQEVACCPDGPCEAGTGNRKAINIAALGAATKNALAKVDSILGQYGPTIEAFTPLQYQAIEAALLAVVHQANSVVNPPAVTDPTALAV